MTAGYPFLISIPHGGLEIPVEIRDEFALDEQDLAYYCDPATPPLFDFPDVAAATLCTPVSRMAVDLNRPPYPMPPRNPDGIVKRRTVDGKPVYRHGGLPPITVIHRLLMIHYFPYHAEIDRLLSSRGIRIAFDCHSMLPVGPLLKKDPGDRRPLICLGNSGDTHGEPKKGRLVTCPPAWIMQLAESFREAFGIGSDVAINTPFSGGFITNAHYWHKGIPWVQIEVNRALYENGDLSGPGKAHADEQRVHELRDLIWQAFRNFWEAVEKEEQEARQ